MKTYVADLKAAVQKGEVRHQEVAADYSRFQEVAQQGAQEHLDAVVGLQGEWVVPLDVEPLEAVLAEAEAPWLGQEAENRNFGIKSKHFQSSLPATNFANFDSSLQWRPGT